MVVRERLAGLGRFLAGAVVAMAAWLAGRVFDASLWGVNLLRDAPVRTGRLALTCGRGARGLLLFVPGSVRMAHGGGWHGLRTWLRNQVWSAAGWLLALVAQALDVVGVPELLSLLMRLFARVTPLSGAEIGAASEVLGSTCLRFGDVRVADGGILDLLFKLNGNRAFTVFHTVIWPYKGSHRQENFAILLHELVHIYQYERLGSPYIGECIYAQATGGYDYGFEEGLYEAHTAGKHFSHFNREQQAQIVQDYFTLKEQGFATKEYLPFVVEMRAGRI